MVGSTHIRTFSRSFAKYKTALEKTDLTKERLQEHPDIVDEIKAFLDSIQEVLHYISPLNAGGKLERNSDFYVDFYEIFDRWETIIPLYNKVRNYVTKKPSEIKKIPLKFDCPTLAKGWDENKENSRKHGRTNRTITTRCLAEARHASRATSNR